MVCWEDSKSSCTIESTGTTFSVPFIVRVKVDGAGGLTGNVTSNALPALSYLALPYIYIHK